MTRAIANGPRRPGSRGPTHQEPTPSPARAPEAGGPDRAGTGRPVVAYVMSRFPKLTETFILTELLGVEAAGARIELYPLLREREPSMHPEAAPWVARAHYLPFISAAIARSHLALIRESPRRYLSTLAAVLRGTWGSANFFLGAIGIWPKVGHMARAMRAAGVEHVHCHFANHPALAGYVISRLVGIPYSFTAHGSDLHVDKTMLAEKVRAASFVVAVSESNRAVIAGVCGGSAPNLEVIRCGIDTALFASSEGADAPVVADAPDDATGEPAIATGTFRILAVGTLHEVKGQVHLLEAIARLSPDGPPVRCRFVGEGPDRATLERRAASLGIVDRVAFLGRRTRSEVADLMRDSDVLVVPSVPTRGGKREGLPVVIPEAMGIGLPVVASRLSGIPEIVVDGVTGLLTPPADAAAIAAALERLRRDPEQGRTLGRAGRSLVEREYDAATNTAALVGRFAASGGAVHHGAGSDGR